MTSSLEGLAAAAHGQRSFREMDQSVHIRRDTPEQNSHLRRGTFRSKPRNKKRSAHSSMSPIENQRKHRKNEREKQRRSEITSKFTELQKLLDLEDGVKPEKVTVLTKAINEITNLRTKISQYENKLAQNEARGRRRDINGTSSASKKESTWDSTHYFVRPAMHVPRYARVEQLMSPSTARSEQLPVFSNVDTACLRSPPLLSSNESHSSSSSSSSRHSSSSDDLMTDAVALVADGMEPTVTNSLRETDASGMRDHQMLDAEQTPTPMNGSVECETSSHQLHEVIDLKCSQEQDSQDESAQQCHESQLSQDAFVSLESLSSAVDGKQSPYKSHEEC